MKITKTERFSSFYESFSDLIFGTMAIFLLLMIALLTQVKQENIEAIKNINKEMSKQIKTSSETIESMQSIITKMAQEVDAIRFKKIEIAIAVDTTGSMTSAIQSLNETMSTLAGILSKTSPDFRITVISYGQNPIIDEFPLIKIKREQEDNGSSLNSLKQYFEKTRKMTMYRGGSAPVRIAMERAITLLNHPTASDDTLQIVLLVGDVGPYEYIPFDQLSWSTEESHIYSFVNNWLRQNTNRRILTVFTATEPLNPDQLESQAQYSASIKFYSNLAGLNNQINSYTNNQGKILALILDAIIKEK